MTPEFDSQDVLFLCYRTIEDAIYLEDGLDGDAGQKVLEMIVPHLKQKDQGILKDEEQTREAGPLY